MNLRPLRSTLWAFVAIALVGCGGSGDGLDPASNPGGASTPPPPGSARLTLLMSADDTPKVRQAWVRLHAAEIARDGRTVKVFESKEGRLIDLAALADAVVPLATATVPDASYDRITLVLGKELTLARGASETAAPMRFADGFDNRDGRTAVRIALTSARNLGMGGDAMVVRARLADWKVSGTTVTPTFSAPRGGDDAKGAPVLLTGRLSGLSGQAPRQTAWVTPEGGTAVRVALGWTTVQVGDGTLADGMDVRVEGAWQKSAEGLRVDVIRVEPPMGAAATGTVARPEPGSRRFTLGLATAEGWLPTHRNLNVLLAPDAALRDAAGSPLEAADFFRDLASAAGASVEGEYDPGSNRFVAKVARLAQDPSKRERTAEGEAVMPAAATAAKVTLESLDGRDVPGEPVLDLMLGEATKYLDAAGKPLSRADFAKALEAGARVRATGPVSDAGTMTPTQARVLSARQAP